MNFRKISKGGGFIFVPKNFIAIFFALETAILVINFRKKTLKGGGEQWAKIAFKEKYLFLM